jgi:monovalent cation:H+ antiporter-2, CPA2 family
MHGLDLILTLTGSLTAALVFGYITQRLKLSPILGYLLAGIVVGRHTPGFVANPAIADELANIGIVLLMFGVGLQLHLRDLAEVGRIAIPGAILQCSASTMLGAMVGRAAGWEWPAAIVFGLAVSVASTAVSVRVLTDNRLLHTRAGHITVGWLVVEDLLTVIVLVILPGLFGSSLSKADTAATLAATAIKLTALAALIVLAGNRVIRWLLDRVAASHSRELFTLAVLVLALGIALGSAGLFGVSLALGAFLAGIVVGRTDYSLRAASEALPMRDAFGVLFFVSIGMLLDPRYVLEAPGLVVATIGVVVVGTPAVAGVLATVLGTPPKTALRVALALAQIGEFSFILAALGRRLGVLGEPAMNTIVWASIVSIMANGVLYRLMGVLERLLSAPSQDLPGAPEASSPWGGQEPGGRRAEAGGQAVVVGYGPTGRTLTLLLRDNGLEPTVVELNLETVRRLRDEGIRAVYGDASYRETLLAAGLPAASHLIIAADLGNSREVIRLARELNNGIQVLARTTYLRDAETLRTAGANEVFSGEGEVALALTEAILHRLGATSEQMDRERERAHRELFG